MQYCTQRTCNGNLLKSPHNITQQPLMFITASFNCWCCTVLSYTFLRSRTTARRQPKPTNQKNY
jgi:hypothetical protein